jgi:hypothetical protein
VDPASNGAGHDDHRDADDDHDEYDHYDDHEPELIAQLPVTFARRRTVDAGTFGHSDEAVLRAPRRLGFGPTFSSIGAYRRWATNAEVAGFPVAGMAMVLGLTDDALTVHTATFVRSRPKRMTGAIPLHDIAQMTAIRALITARIVLLLRDGGIIELESVRVGRARRFVAAVLAQRG